MQNCANKLTSLHARFFFFFFQNALTLTTARFNENISSIRYFIYFHSVVNNSMMTSEERERDRSIDIIVLLFDSLRSSRDLHTQTSTRRLTTVSTFFLLF